jgi:hypothetical protein
MSERLHIKDVLTSPKTAATILLSSLALAGCGNTKSADTNPLGTCGSNAYSEAASPSPNLSPSQAVATAKQDVLTLQQRALRAGGTIDLPRYDHTTEIEASQDNLRLSFDRSDVFEVADHINFVIKGPTSQISEGAVMCFAGDNNLEVNGTFTTLQQYVNETASLDK